MGKVPKDNRTNGKGKKSASGTRFDRLWEVEDHILSEGVDLHRKTKGAVKTRRRKKGEVLSSNREGAVRSQEREKLNLEKGERSSLVLVVSHITTSAEREKEEQALKVKEREAKVNKLKDEALTNLVGLPLILGPTAPSLQTKTSKPSKNDSNQ